ncbi:hypothetical protein WKK05_38380 (plasmid) [Nostoc sp. UHCC 0302]|uniref:hypothetical protein n=1 Tax=Nostoc sp. UHCC 0302 TaxID=3134896 RepID=UPI00311CCE6F
MSLLEFLCKWDSTEELRLQGMLCTFFERDPRTIRNWMNRTPKYVKWVLAKLDQEWSEVGEINYSVFFKY